MRRLIVCAVVLCTSAFSQGTDSALSGTVVDPTGSTIPAAKITALNTRTGVSLVTAANASGVYLFPTLLPGVYRVTGEQQGFKTLVISDVTLNLSDRVTLNLSLELGSVAESVEVASDGDSPVNYSTASVGGVITGQRIEELPLINRSALGLVLTQAGVVSGNFSGSQIVGLNIALDGINVQDNRINQGLSSTLFLSVDRVSEVRIITSPADVEFGRGSGQVIFTSRSGSNEFRGSLFEFHRNTILRANTFFNNQRGDPRPILIRNQYGARIGGPIFKNKTFFHAHWEEQRTRSTATTTRTVFTQSARQGVFRFFQGVQNANANSTQATVNLDGSPRRPASASGDLQAVSLFGRDPNRLAPDTTGVVKKMLDLMPPPNDFRTGDGLNTAGYRFGLPSAEDQRQIDFRVDHYFTSAHRFFASYNWENLDNPFGFMPSPYPGLPSGLETERVRVLSTTLSSTLSPNVLNEFRAGFARPKRRLFAPWEVAGADSLPKISGQPYIPVFSALIPQLSNPFRNDNDPQGRISPVYQYADNISWLKNKHAFKGGVEVRLVSSNGFNSFDVMPRVTLGAGGAAVQGVSGIPGISQNQTNAQNLLNDLSGSVASIAQAFNASGGLKPAFLGGEPKQRTWKTREFSWYFKDDYKVNPDLTLNLGVRYEYYGVPFDPNGKAAALAGGSGSIFGISGTDFSALHKPGLQNGQLTRVLTVGANSPNPELGMFNPDRNNLLPAVGVAWHVPQVKWLGEKRLVLRAGYGWAFERTSSLRLVDVVSGDLPGLRERRLYTQPQMLTLASAGLPLAPEGKPLDILNNRETTMRVFDSGLQSPWIQNWNFTVARELARGTSLEVRYVGSRGTRLIRGADMNEQNLFETGILDAFKTTLAGGNAPLLDVLFRGFNVAGRGPVDGVNVRGSELARTNSTIQAFFTGNNPGGFANYLNTTTDFTTLGRGGIPRRAGFPENWITVNPQFASARLFGNFSDSSYHAMQIEVKKRFSAGWTLLSNYTWSKALGDEDGDDQEQNNSFRSLRNRSLDKRILDYNISHAIRNSGTWELPIGPGKLFMRDKKGLLARLVEGWEIGGIYNLFSGRPFSLTGSANTYSNLGGATPVALAPISGKLGRAVRTGNGIQYFEGLQVVNDPLRQTMSPDLAARSTLRAVADSSGKLLIVNSQPGTVGGLSELFFQGPGSFRLDLNLIKRVRISERVNFQLRMDVENATNSPQWDRANVTNSINSLTFGVITATTGDARIVVVGGRINF